MRSEAEIREARDALQELASMMETVQPEHMEQVTGVIGALAWVLQIECQSSWAMDRNLAEARRILAEAAKAKQARTRARNN